MYLVQGLLVMGLWKFFCEVLDMLFLTDVVREVVSAAGVVSSAVHTLVVDTENIDFSAPNYSCSGFKGYLWMDDEASVDAVEEVSL